MKAVNNEYKIMKYNVINNNNNENNNNEYKGNINIM